MTSLQSQVDANVAGFVHQTTDLKSLAALSVAGASYRLGRIGMMGAGSGNIVRALSIGAGLATEVSAFEATNRFLGSSAENKNLWQWAGQRGLKQGLLSSFVSFSTLKGFGSLTQGQNIILQHGAQDAAMVLGHRFVHQMGIGPQPTGSLAEQLLHAEATNLQLSAGMALVGTGLPGAQAMERGLDLSLSVSKGLRSNDEDLGSSLAFAFAGSSSLEAVPTSKSKEILLSLDSPMASLGGGLKRKDFPYSVNQVFQKEGTSLDIKLLSRKPIHDKSKAALKFAEAFLTLLASGAEEATLQGAVASQLRASAELRSFLMSPMKKVSLQFDLDGAEILTLRVFKDDLRIDFSVPAASQWAELGTTEPEAFRPVLEGNALLKALNLPLQSLGLSTKASSAVSGALGMREQEIRMGDLVRLRSGVILGQWSVGPKTVAEINAALVSVGLSLDMPVRWTPPERYFSRPVEDLKPSERVKNILAWHGIQYIGQLVQKTSAELKRTPNVGKETAREIETLLEPLGLSLGMRIHWEAPKPPSLDQSVEELELSVRAANALTNLKIETVGQLIQRSEQDLRYNKWIGGKTLREIKELLANMGLSLRGDWEGKMTEDQWKQMDQPIQTLSLSPRTMAVLGRDGYRYLGDLARQSSQEFQRSRDIGARRLTELKEALKELGLSFGMDLSFWRNPQERSLDRRSTGESASPSPRLPPGEPPTVTQILGFDLPYAFDSAAFNVRALQSLGSHWAEAHEAGIRLLQRMGEEFRTNEKETNEEKKKKVEGILTRVHEDLIETVLSERVRKGTGPKTIFLKIGLIRQALDMDLARARIP